MFDAYLRMVWRDPNPNLHGTAAALRSVLRASGAHIEARAIQLGVSIEGLLKSEFPDLVDRVTTDTVQLNKAKLAIEDTGLEKSMKNRVLGVISSMHRPRPQELLRVLADDGRVREKFVSVYRELRNPAVHGETARDEDLQKWVDSAAAGLTLLYELIFARIGYSGPYTDYSELGQPTIEYPPTARDEG